MATYTFAVSGETNLTEDTYGLLQNFSKSDSADEAVAQDSTGNVADVTIYNKVTEYNAEYVLDTALTLPSVGDEIAVGGTDKYTVMSVEKTESNTDYQRGSMTLKRYTSNGIPANS